MLIDLIHAERREVLKLIASRYARPFSAYRVNDAGKSVDLRAEYKTRDRQLLADYDAILAGAESKGRA